MRAYIKTSLKVDWALDEEKSPKETRENDQNGHASPSLCSLGMAVHGLLLKKQKHGLASLLADRVTCPSFLKLIWFNNDSISVTSYPIILLLPLTLQQKKTGPQRNTCPKLHGSSDARQEQVRNCSPLSQYPPGYGGDTGRLSSSASCLLGAGCTEIYGSHCVYRRV